ncbi:MAG TPA: isochorismatase family cysteine hydrolase [Pseudonocardia sp.]|jgi:biuret amidohydrolase|nr:isochorismatase family cysteine hydrolase [Pseudonocardia sp.]
MATFGIDPARTALVVIDLQNCFVEGTPFSAPGGPEIVARLGGLIDTCRDHGIRVIYTAHVVRADHSNVGTLGDTIPAIHDGVIDDGSETAALHRDVKVLGDDIVLKKPRFGAFQGTDLEMILRSQGIDTIIVGGITTNFCSETTAREAHARDFKVIFLSDGTTTFDLPDAGWGPIPAEEAHRFACTVLAFGFAEVTTVAAVQERITGA